VLNAHCEDRILLYQAEAYLGRATNQWWLPYGRLDHLPLWKDAERNPPISLKKAISLARKWTISKIGHDGDIDQVLLRPIGPDVGQSKLSLSFFYAIEFSVNPYGNHITCVVLMDGTVLEPLRILERGN
jgi:hypothetical protein